MFLIVCKDVAIILSRFSIFTLWSLSLMNDGCAHRYGFLNILIYGCASRATSSKMFLLNDKLIARV